MSDGPSWLTIDDLFRLVIAAPNRVTAVGEYTFHLNIWTVILVVEAPCDSTYLQGVDQVDHATVHLDE